MDWSMSATQLVVVLLPLTTVITLQIIRRIFRHHKERKGCPLPPGPTPLPLLGSALSIDYRRLWLSFTRWHAKFGDIVYIRVLDTDIIVLNSTSVATELLEKRSQIYSDRPSVATATAPYFDFNFAISRYGEHWRLCRRIFQQTFRANAALRFRPMQLRRACQLVNDLINGPDDYPSHFLTFSVAVALSAVYDYEPSPRKDTMVSIVDNFLRVAVPGLSPVKLLLVRAFPFLLHTPDWLFVSSIKREMNEAYACRNELVETPYRYIKERMESKDHISFSMVSDHIARMEKLDGSYRSEYETALKHASATTLHGAADTMSAALMTFTLAMVENPHVWKRAQAEIDAVVGTDRLPGFDDRPSLPYVDAITREVFRWRPVFPLGGPHAVTQSDIYKGYYIPKGAIVLANAWAMSRDEAWYPDGDEFMPERFLNTEGILTDDDPYEFAFGFGRRRCPGRYAADASVWSAVVTMLASLDFNLARDQDGNDITFKATFTSGATEHPNPFPCRLTPRAHVCKEFLDRVPFPGTSDELEERPNAESDKH